MSTSQPSCVFCRIVADHSKAAIVFEDDATLAFLDPRQANEGHLLIVPKRHVETVCDLGENDASRLFRVVPRIARALQAALRPDGISMWQSNGHGAHQEVPHAHIHLMPRYVGDGLLRIYPTRVANAPREQLDVCADRIRDALTTMR